MRMSDLLFMSLGAIVASKLRSVLTLVGVVAGVASIIAVMTAIAVVQSTMEQEMSVLGAQVFQAQKWPAGGFHSPEERRKAMRRPPLTVANANAIREQVATADLVGSELWDFGYKVEYRGEETNANVSICGGTPEYPANNTHYVGLGRNISQMDVKSGRNVAVIGYAIGQKLFPFTDPVGKEIRLDGRKYEVIGVFDEKKSAFGSNYDNYVLIPVTTFLDIYGMVNRDGFSRSVNITVRAKSPELMRDAMEETRQVLRRERGVKPNEEDNFDFFNSESLITQFNQTTAKVKIAAFVIGIIALVVAGIGIMNIMLVSVTERTKEIGIRKSLGARPGNILTQFLLEAVILCNIGGVVGIVVGFALGNVITAFTSFEANVPLEWAVIGLVFCSTVGIAFGLLPAIRASRLSPIDALR
ncbi:MAG TPA: ABC transporter permease, partial [Candidatus Krumholzibacteria bacterium]|nr:ABC transporter permease [Candidatus Krumholzibacteria bacterium]